MIMRFKVGTVASDPQDAPLQITPATDLTPGIDPFLADPTRSRSDQWNKLHLKSWRYTLSKLPSLAHPERGLRCLRPSDPDAGNKRAEEPGQVWPVIPRPGHGEPDGRRCGDLGDLQSHGRYPPDSLPPGERPDPEPRAFRSGIIHGSSRMATRPSGPRGRPIQLNSGGRKR